MKVVKRWAFAPALLIVLIIIGGLVAGAIDHSHRALGSVIGLVVAVPIAVVVAHRRHVRGW